MIIDENDHSQCRRVSFPDRACHAVSALVFFFFFDFGLSVCDIHT